MTSKSLLGHIASPSNGTAPSSTARADFLGPRLLAEKGFATSPQHWFSDESRVAVLTQITQNPGTSLTELGAPIAGQPIYARRGGRLQVGLNESAVHNGQASAPAVATIRARDAWTSPRRETAGCRCATGGSGGDVPAPGDRMRG
jgi:hypothetical protein